MKKSVKREFISILIISFISILLFGMWNFNIEKNSQNKNWKMSDIDVNNIVELLKGNEPDGKEGFVKAFLSSIFIKNDITERNLTILTTTILILALNIFIYLKLDKDIKVRYKYYSICLYIFEILYIIYMLFVYLFLFNVEETNVFSSYERYFGTVALGILLYHILIGLEYQRKIDAKRTIIILSILLSFLPIQVITEKIIDGDQDKRIAMIDRKTYIKILNYKNILTENDKIYYIDTTPNTSKYTLQIMKYQMVPIKIDNEYLTNLVEKVSIETLKKCGYTHLYIQKSNESLKDELEGKCVENLEEKTLYKINYEGNTIKLEKVEIYG